MGERNNDPRPLGSIVAPQLIHPLHPRLHAHATAPNWDDPGASILPHLRSRLLCVSRLRLSRRSQS